MMKIQAQLIMEVLGKPREYVKQVLESLRESLEKEAGVLIKEASIGEPKETKDSKEFFTGYLDVMIECEKIENLLMLCFKYMPAHVELFYPETIEFSNVQLNELLNALTTKLHSYDEVARVLAIQKFQLEQEIVKMKKSENKTDENIEKPKGKRKVK